MMNPTVALTDGPSIRKAVAEVLRGSMPAYIASPYWSKGTIDAVGLESGSLKGKLEILCDLRSGSCDPDAIRALLARGAKVFSVDRLHAKVYMGDAGVIVGSANATAKGLWHGSSKNDGNHEAALWSKGRGATVPWRTWWTSMVANGIDLTNEQAANLLFDVAREENESAAPKPVSLMKALLSGSYRAGNVKLFVRIDWQHADSATKEAALRLSKRLHATIGYWQNWPDMPPGANIISFMLEDNGSVRVDGMWRTSTKPKAATDRKTKAIYVSSVELVDGRYKVDSDKRRWCHAVKLCVKDPSYERYFRGRADGKFMPIAVFVPFLRRAG